MLPKIKSCLILAALALFAGCAAQQGYSVTVIYNNELSREVWTNFTLVYPDEKSESTLDIAYPGTFPAFRFSVPRGNISIKVGIYNYSSRFFQPQGIEPSAAIEKNFLVEKDTLVLVNITMNGKVRVEELKGR